MAALLIAIKIVVVARMAKAVGMVLNLYIKNVKNIYIWCDFKLIICLLQLLLHPRTALLLHPKTAHRYFLKPKKTDNLPPYIK